MNQINEAYEQMLQQEDLNIEVTVFSRDTCECGQRIGDYGCRYCGE